MLASRFLLQDPPFISGWYKVMYVQCCFGLILLVKRKNTLLNSYLTCYAGAFSMFNFRRPFKSSSSISILILFCVCVFLVSSLAFYVQFWFYFNVHMFCVQFSFYFNFQFCSVLFCFRKTSASHISPAKLLFSNMNRKGLWLLAKHYTNAKISILITVIILPLLSLLKHDTTFA